MSKKSGLKIINLGNLLDFVEFSMFSALMPIISKEFFSDSGSPEAASLLYILFFIGFLGRPFGAILFGFIGDRFGRRRTLVLSILGMSISTFMLSITPVCSISHYLIGLTRFLQGVFTGGEYANAIVCVIEEKSTDNGFKNAANLTASGIFGASVGQIIGMFIAGGWLPMMNWRYAFALVSVISLIISLNRAYKIPDSPREHPVMKVKSKYDFRIITQGIIFGGLMNGFFYLIYTFLGTFSSLNANKIFMDAYLMSLISSLLLGGMLILCSRLKIFKMYDPSSVLRFGLIGMLVLIYPMYRGLSSGEYSYLSFLLLAAFVFFMQTTTLIILSCYPKQFPVGSRVLLSGMSISIGNSLIGGSSPYISAKIIHFTESKSTPVFYFIGLIVITFVVASLWKLKSEGIKNEPSYH